ncbi:MAG: dihydrodipicolinate synthase family protein, partial [Exilibacterium sp.]
CGTTGETPPRTTDEWSQVVAATLLVADGEVPVTAGVGYALSDAAQYRDAALIDQGRRLRLRASVPLPLLSPEELGYFLRELNALKLPQLRITSGGLHGAGRCG